MHTRSVRRFAVALSLVILAAGSLTGAAWGQTPAPARPNVLFILADDLGYGDLGAFFQTAREAAGQLPAMRTPALDQLAATGARLTHHYAAAPVCAPSRASLLSGLHQGHATVRNNQFDKALADNHTLATVLRQAGYATAAVGKWGLPGIAERGAPFWPAHPQERGFDFFFGYMRHVDGHEHYPKEAPYRNRDNTRPRAKAPGTYEETDVRPKLFGKEVWENRREISETLDACYTTDLFTARTKRWIVEQQQSQPEKPFFAYLAFDTPHAVLELPTGPYPTGGGLNGGLQWLGTPGRMITTADGKIDSWIHPDFLHATYDDDRDPTTPAKPWPEVYQRYATSVRRIDDAVGDLVQLLRDLKIDQNTLIIFSSDNGPSLESYLPTPFSPEFLGGFGPFEGVKRDLWEGGTRTPTIAHWPAKIPSGTLVETPSAHWDWLPTFAEAAGLPVPANADGVSLLPHLSGAVRARSGGPLYFEYQQDGRTPNFPAFAADRRNRRRGQMQALRIGDLVGVRYDIQTAADDFELYDLVQDPKQRQNLAADPRYAGWQQTLKDTVLRVRRSDPSAARPYDTAPVPPVTPKSTEPGLRWQRFSGMFPWVPQLPGHLADSRGVASQVSLAAAGPTSTPSVVQFDGYVTVAVEGEYTFMLRADTGAVIRLHDATLFDCDQGYQTGEAKTATVRLQAGLHPIRIIHRSNGVTPVLDLQWSGPGFQAQPLPAKVLRH